MHALVRFGLGRKAGESLPADPHAWLAGQLDGPDPDLARPAPTVGEMLAALQQDRAERRAGGSPSHVKDLWQPELAAIMTNLVDTDVGFRERLVWFWANHFTVSSRQGEVIPCLGPYLREAIRPHVTGRFADMLLAVMTHPAMLFYLDNAHSVGPDSPAGRRRHLGLNENLARECLELHTVTPAAGYTQADVTAFAAVLTGWSVEMKPPLPGFAFQPNAHQPGTQTVLGLRWAPGQQGGLDILAWLGRHPATYRNIAHKLAVHFVADAPSPAVTQRIEAALHASDGSLRAAALAAATAPEAWGPPTKLRTPFDYVTAVLRAAAPPLDKPQMVAQWQGLLGQPPFGAPLPNGWSDQAVDWSDGEALVRRIDWAWVIAGRSPDTDPMQAAQDSRAAPATLERMRHAGSRREALTMLLASPEFMRR